MVGRKAVCVGEKGEETKSKFKRILISSRGLQNTMTIRDIALLVVYYECFTKTVDSKGVPFNQRLENARGRSDSDTITESKVAVKCRAATSARPPAAAEK